MRHWLVGRVDPPDVGQSLSGSAWLARSTEKRSVCKPASFELQPRVEQRSRMYFLMSGVWAVLRPCLERPPVRAAGLTINRRLDHRLAFSA
jgi:hypothetical protein